MSAAGPLHPRNRHQGRYAMGPLVEAVPDLRRHLRRAPDGDQTIDFSDARAVRLLNQALLAVFYGVRGWSLPEGYLCPPIPGRADYLHYAADLLAGGGPLPKGPGVRVLDIGTGANGVYPLIGTAAYGWSFLASDIHRPALDHLATVLARNPERPITLRHQRDPRHLLVGVLEPGERLDLVMTNPPFHASAHEAAAGTARKWRNLGRDHAGLNFGGQSQELVCPGGETAFISTLIAESPAWGASVRWFTSLVAGKAHLPALDQALYRVRPTAVRVIPMRQGAKPSRILAWTFQPPA